MNLKAYLENFLGLLRDDPPEKRGENTTYRIGVSPPGHQLILTLNPLGAGYTFEEEDFEKPADKLASKIVGEWGFPQYFDDEAKPEPGPGVARVRALLNEFRKQLGSAAHPPGHLPGNPFGIQLSGRKLVLCDNSVVEYELRDGDLDLPAYDAFYKILNRHRGTGTSG